MISLTDPGGYVLKCPVGNGCVDTWHKAIGFGGCCDPELSAKEKIMGILGQTDPLVAVETWPFIVLGISIVFIIIAITLFRLHAFLALILAALIAGWLTPAGQLSDSTEADTSAGHLIDVINVATKEFGSTAGGIGIVIALAALIGMCLLESGAADKIVRRFIGFFGEQRAALALLISGFLLSIPVFFDTVFFLLVPLARAMSLRAGKHFMLYVMAIAGGGAITHSIIPPTPGPLLVGDALGIELGKLILAGVIFGILPAIGVHYMAKAFDRWVPVPIRETSGVSLTDLEAIVNKKDEELPSFGWALAPVLLPAVLIALASVFNLLQESSGISAALSRGGGLFGLHQAIQFLGNKIIAMMLGTFIAMGIYWRQAGLTLEQLGQKLGSPLETAGVIILITSAGGAFGAMIRHAGVGDAIQGISEAGAISYVVLAWVVTVVVRVAQGSATVAMITGSALMASVVGDGSGLAYHPIYIYLSIGFGSMFFSWMNDSGFWVVCKLSGFTQNETLKSWSLLLTGISVIGFLETLLLSVLLPLK